MLRFIKSKNINFSIISLETATCERCEDNVKASDICDTCFCCSACCGC